MYSDGSEFMQSVWEICGLTAFEPFTLPQWLRERVDDVLASPHGENLTDRERVERHLDGPEGDRLIGDWGKAVISGEKVFLFESNYDCSDGFFNHFDVAEMLECGALFVEPSRCYWSGQRIIYTEHRHSIKLNSPCNEHDSMVAGAIGVSLSQ